MADGMTPNAIEYQLKLYVTPADLKLSEQKPSEIIRFMQAGLTALGYQGAVDGVYSAEFQQNLNGFVVQKQQEKVGITKGWLGDNHTAVVPVQGIAGISGPHIAAISDSLYEAGAMNSGLQVQLLGALKQINHPMLNSYTQEFERDLKEKGVEVPKAPVPLSSNDDTYKVTASAGSPVRPI